MSSRARVANEAWESLLRAHAVLMKEFQDDPVWDGGEAVGATAGGAGFRPPLSMREYDVLYTLAKCDSAISLTELNRHVLLSQPAMSRMVERLAGRGLIDRGRDPADGRGVRLSLTAAGAALQRSVGRRHALAVSQAMSDRLSRTELLELQRLCAALAQPAAAAG